MKKSQLNLVRVCQIGMVAGICAIIAPISLPTGVIPITLATLTAIMAGILLPPISAAVSQIVYIMLGVVGLPVFSNWRGGVGMVVGPTGGFILAFPLLAFAVSFAILLAERRTESPVKLRIFAGIGMLFGQIVFFTIGAIWFSVVTGNDFATTMNIAVIGFLPGEAIKMAFAVGVIIEVRRQLKKAVPQLY